ncbi:hypothetical protein KJ068_01290 [bacterium]|nr:hypothetical protein [bacterium]
MIPTPRHNKVKDICSPRPLCAAVEATNFAVPATPHKEVGLDAVSFVALPPLWGTENVSRSSAHKGPVLRNIAQGNGIEAGLQCITLKSFTEYLL